MTPCDHHDALDARAEFRDDIGWYRYCFNCHTYLEVDGEVMA